MHRRNRNHYIAKGMPVIGSIEVQRPKRGLIVAKGDRRISAFNSQIVGKDHLRHVGPDLRSEEHTSELQSLMRISYPVFCLKKKTTISTHNECHTANYLNT